MSLSKPLLPGTLYYDERRRPCATASGDIPQVYFDGQPFMVSGTTMLIVRQTYLDERREMEALIRSMQRWVTYKVNAPKYALKCVAATMGLFGNGWGVVEGSKRVVGDGTITFLLELSMDPTPCPDSVCPLCPTKTYNGDCCAAHKDASEESRLRAQILAYLTATRDIAQWTVSAPRYSPLERLQFDSGKGAIILERVQE